MCVTVVNNRFTNLNSVYCHSYTWQQYKLSNITLRTQAFQNGGDKWLAISCRDHLQHSEAALEPSELIVTELAQVLTEIDNDEICWTFPQLVSLKVCGFIVPRVLFAPFTVLQVSLTTWIIWLCDFLHSPVTLSFRFGYPSQLLDLNVHFPVFIATKFHTLYSKSTSHHLGRLL
jgi:hypothetical protein